MSLETILTIAVFVLEFAFSVAVAALVVLRSRSSPSVRLAWLVVVLAVPILSIIASSRRGWRARLLQNAASMVAPLL